MAISALSDRQIAEPTRDGLGNSGSSTLYPLRFEPILKRLIWGGRQLGSVLSKPIGDGHDYAESWEVADHRAGRSVISEGRLTGVDLGSLLREHRAALLGPHLAACDHFPLLVNFLDARQTLSLQVHPNDEQGRRLVGDNGKTETWVVLQAEPGSVLYAGLRRKVTRKSFEKALAGQGIESLLHSFPAQAGDCIQIEAGTVHAIGAGVMMAEIQQSSDATFRVHDWDRRNADGSRRTLHVAEALECIDFDAGPVDPIRPRISFASWGMREYLAHCPYFSLERLNLSDAVRVGRFDRFTILIGLEGRAHVEHDGLAYSLERGETLLLPAILGPCRVVPDGNACILTCVVP